MRKLAIASIRRAADEIRNSRKHVSVSALARSLKVNRHLIYSYLKGIDGLAEEIGLPGSTHEAAKNRYEAAIERLKLRGVKLSRPAVAKEAGVSRSAFTIWLIRYPRKAEALGIVEAH